MKDTTVKNNVTPTPTVVPTEKLIALTFDDGPDVQTTPLVLDRLEKYGVKASFFLIGKNINDQTIPIMKRELELGCEIDNHSWTHSDMTTITEDQMKKEIQDTSAKIYETLGVTPKFFRPPFIKINPTMYQTIDLPFINGINGLDWDASVTAEKRAELILDQAQDGNIILLHDFTGNDNTVTALDTIIPGLQEKGFTFVTVSELFERKGVESNVKDTIWSLVK